MARFLTGGVRRAAGLAGALLLLAGCAGGMMADQGMMKDDAMKEDGSMMKDDAMKKDGPMMKDDKGTMEKK